MARTFMIWLLATTADAALPTPKLLPQPASMAVGGDAFTLNDAVRLIPGEGPAGANAAARLSDLMRTQNVTLSAAGKGPAIRFVHRAGMPAEGYRLVTDTSGATITASDDAGLLYGAVTLWQLATQDPGHHVPAVTMEDHPRFGWRGLMLDSARHFQSPEYVRHLIDWMAVNKLNRLHWHLVDDQGWRIEIKKYPKLTQVSGSRLPAAASGAPDLPPVSGFYTQDQIREIVAYAQARGIVIVPEIEMPGHAVAAIRAYPELGTGSPLPDRVWSEWGVFPWLYNVEEPTFGFLGDVLTEVMALFPSPWIHLGGDEAVKDQWRTNPAIQAKIKQLGLADEEALQGWFMARMGKFVSDHGRRMIGWDEILMGGVPPSATVMSWRGIDGAIAAAKAGHDAVLSPAPILYFDNRQGTGPNEPPGRGNLITLEKVLAFDPVPAAIPAEQRKHILGLQANLWTEHVRTEERAAWMQFPRASAIAEIGWAQEGPRPFGNFVTRLVPQLDRMAPLGLRPADSLFAIDTTIEAADATANTVALANQSALPIRYTTDGSVPTAASPLFAEMLSFAQPVRLRAASFLGDRVMPGAIDRMIDAEAARTRTSRDLQSCGEGGLLDLEDDYPARGPRAHFLVNITHPCWTWRGAPMAGARTIALSVGQVPFNFQIGADRDKIRFRPPATPAGEFEVRSGSCDGPVVATLPLAVAAGNPGVTRLTAPLAPVAGKADLCFTYTARGVNPLWAIDKVELLPQ
ncbi:family 20 glycosylhydrolase [uncultured Sphingomonas sp.]|uniref:family 20 glycosylhydrolase n=1 Tax=uncultured Sphingomonas sp. TaxID=158754 RepID=UPI0025DBBBE3|nr:family 20 glycosylhydrolase [uncultured Sphingomonas sp.]